MSTRITRDREQPCSRSDGVALFAHGRSGYELPSIFYSDRFRIDGDTLDIDAPLNAPAQAQTQAQSQINPEQLAMIIDMGFTSAQAKKALRESVGVWTCLK